MTELSLLGALALFQVKHYLADFQFQTLWMLRNKGSYGHPAGLLHAGLHALLSAPVLLLLMGVPADLALALMAAELAVHYHTDWAKERIGRASGADAGQPRFWHLLGLDQALHQWTYLAMLAVIALR